MKLLGFLFVSLNPLSAIENISCTWKMKKPRLSAPQGCMVANDSDENGWWMVWFQGIQRESDWYSNHETFDQHHAFETYIKCPYYILSKQCIVFFPGLNTSTDSGSGSNIHLLHRQLQLTEKANSWSSLYFL